MEEQKKVGVITLPMNANYGCVFQAHAMMAVITKLGYNPILINRRWDETPTLWHNIKRLMYQKTIMRPFNKFIINYVSPMTKRLVSQTQITEEANNGYHAFVVGSDQVWRYKHTTGVGNNFFLDFVKDSDIKKISYAPSLGVDFWDDENKSDKTVISTLLKQFDAVSVRENSGIKVLKDNFGVDAVHVLDPTLLLDETYYREKFCISKSETNTLAVYVLDISDEQKRVIERIAQEKSLTPVYLAPAKKAMSPSLDLIKNYSKYNFVPVKTWLETIANSKYVITDSFHGTCFSVIFGKQFVTIANKVRGKARFSSLLGVFDLENRMCDNILDLDNDIINSVIDYNQVNKKLSQSKEMSLTFFNQALK